MCWRLRSVQILFFLVIVAFEAKSQKTDTLYLNNGDRIIGEIKQLKYGILTYKTSAASTLSIKWPHVDSLVSNKQFRVKFENGTEWFGTLDSLHKQNNLLKLFSGMEEGFQQENYAEIVPVKRTFISRIDGMVSLGFSYTKASEISNLNLGAGATYRAQGNLFELRYDGITTVDAKQNQVNRKQDLRAQYLNFLPNDWLAQVFGAFEQNLELGLESRVYGGVGGGYNFFETNHAFWAVTMGPLYSYELSTNSEEPTRENWEAVIRSQLKLFSFSSPNISFDFTFSAYPSFTVKDRIRVNSDAKFKWEIFGDFYWEWSFYENYDNKPVSVEGSTNDYGVTTGISYYF